MQETFDLLTSAPRMQVLRFLAPIINEFTIVARGTYDQPDAEHQFRRLNEDIHRLSGHLRDLTQADQALTASRAEAIITALYSLQSERAAKIKTLIIKQ